MEQVKGLFSQKFLEHNTLEHTEHLPSGAIVISLEPQYLVDPMWKSDFNNRALLLIAKLRMLYNDVYLSKNSQGDILIICDEIKTIMGAPLAKLIMQNLEALNIKSESLNHNMASALDFMEIQMPAIVCLDNMGVSHSESISKANTQNIKDLYKIVITRGELVEYIESHSYEGAKYRFTFANERYKILLFKSKTNNNSVKEVYKENECFSCKEMAERFIGLKD